MPIIIPTEEPEWRPDDDWWAWFSNNDLAHFSITKDRTSGHYIAGIQPAKDLLSGTDNQWCYELPTFADALRWLLLRYGELALAEFAAASRLYPLKGVVGANVSN